MVYDVIEELPGFSPSATEIALGFEGKEVKAMCKDPVCGMEVDEKRAKATSTYDGETYYFCGDGCRAAFETEPRVYLSGEKRRAHRC